MLADMIDVVTAKNRAEQNNCFIAPALIIEHGRSSE
jgi:hypothetical protein